LILHKNNDIAIQAVVQAAQARLHSRAKERRTSEEPKRASERESETTSEALKVLLAEGKASSQRQEKGRTSKGRSKFARQEKGTGLRASEGKNKFARQEKGTEQAVISFAQFRSEKSEPQAEDL
jgi:hypothetical protein